jgi:hypothetical protein
MTNYYQQSETAEALWRLAARIAVGNRGWLSYLRSMAHFNRRDFPTVVAADTLGVDYFDVMPLEREAVKQGLFNYLYGTPGDTITRVGDMTFIERGVV